jgi:AraC-like DNA-binding protein
MTRDHHRDLLIRSMRTGGATLQEIADEFSISRERVRQLLTRMGETQPLSVDPVRAFNVLAEDTTITNFTVWAARLSGGSAPLVTRLCAEMGRTAEVEALFVSRRADRKRATLVRGRVERVAKAKALGALLGRSPRVREYRKHYGVHPCFQRYFGTWAACLIEAGLDPVPRGRLGHLGRVAA